MPRRPLTKLMPVLMLILSATCAARPARRHAQRRTWIRNQVVALDEMFLRLRFGSTGQDSFPCTGEVATITSDALRTCLTSYAQPLCGLPSPGVALGAASCASDSLVSIDGGSLDFLGSNYKPSTDEVNSCITTVVESPQCLPILRQAGLGSLYQVRVQSSPQYTVEPTTFPTSPPATALPTRVPVASTGVPTAGQTSDAPSGSPTLLPASLPPTSAAPSAPPTSSPVEDTSVPTSAATPSPAPVEQQVPTEVPSGTIEVGAGPIPAGAVSEETSTSESRSASSNLPMIVGVAIGGFVLLALLVGLERERRRKRRGEGGDDDGYGSSGAVPPPAAVGGAGSTDASYAKARAAATAAAPVGLWLGWMGKRRRGEKETSRDMPLAAEQWDDTGSAAEEGSYRDDLRLMAMVEVGQEEDDVLHNGKGAVAAPSGDEPSPAATAKTGALSSSSSTTSEADTDKSPDDGSIATSQAIGAGAATCPQPVCFAGDNCTKSTFASFFGYYRTLGLSALEPAATGESAKNIDAAMGGRPTLPDVEEAPQEFEPDRSWNPDDNSVGSAEGAGNDLFQPCNPATVDDQSSLVALASAGNGNDPRNDPSPPSTTAMTDDQSSLVALASQNSGSCGVPGVLSYRMMPVEITPDEDLIDVPLRPVTFQAADTVEL